VEAAIMAARINRVAGQMADPSPASQVMEIIDHIQRAMKAVLKHVSGDRVRFQTAG
jgi:NAD(P)H-hydrate repair Nnr-like enzyme with NAD(P)H-hydrate dehydratase domain